MATTDRAQLNRALLSVYHYGRRQPGKRLHGRPVPLAVMPLHQAVSVLTAELQDEHTLHPIRLALGDLCRTRSGGRNPKVDRQIDRLATAFSRSKHRDQDDRVHAGVSRRFANIFASEKKERAVGEDAAHQETLAYQAALKLMIAPLQDDHAAADPASGWNSSEVTGLPEGAPASYEGKATVAGTLEEMTARLDPQGWAQAFPYIWNFSFITDSDYFVSPATPPITSPATPPIATTGGLEGAKKAVSTRAAAAESAGGSPRLALPPDTSDFPHRSDSPPATSSDGPGPKLLMPPGQSGNPPPMAVGNHVFYEEALFGGYTYRNILKVRLAKGTKDDPSKPIATYTYSQHACFNTGRDALDLRGGIDVDSGTASVTDNENGTITVDVCKQVRFTQPALFVDELNDLAHVFVPLSLDSWIHGLIFSSPQKEKTDGNATTTPARPERSGNQDAAGPSDALDDFSYRWRKGAEPVLR